MAAGTPRENLQDALLELERALARAEKRVASETSDIVVMSFQRLGQSQGRSFERVSGDHLGGMQVELVASDYRNVRTNEFIEIWREEIRASPAYGGSRCRSGPADRRAGNWTSGSVVTIWELKPLPRN